MKPGYEITMSEYLMGRDAANPLDNEQISNSKTIVERVNKLLDLFYSANPTTHRRKVNSGYRPAAINSATPGAAKKSNHLICAACDLEDADGELDKWCMDNLKKLSECGLWLEHPESTVGWCHLQCKPPASGNRVFKVKQ